MATRNVLGIILLAIATLPRPAAAQVRYCDSAHENCRTELIRLIRAETQGIYTIQWYTRDTGVVNELIQKHRAGVPVRFIMDRKSENTSRSGVIEQIFHGQRVVARGSSNWSPGSDRGHTNLEINFFSNPVTNPEDLDAYAYHAPKFERRWSNLQHDILGQVTESKPFVPLSPGSSTYVSPANASTVATTTPTLRFTVKWAHYVDVYLGTSSTNMTLIRNRMPVTPNSTVTVEVPALAAGTHYWRVVARTAANKTSTGAVWSFAVS